MSNIKDVIEDIKNQIDAEQVKNKIAADKGLKLKNDKCLCFIHGEKNPSMSFNSKKKRFKCFSCGESYDIFTHYQEYYGLSFLEGVRSIIKDFSLNIYLEENKSVRKANKKPTVFEGDISFGVLEYINKRKISKAIIDKVKNVKCDGKGNIVFQYKNENGELVANKFRPARKVKKEDKCPKMWFEKDTNINTLFNMENVNITKPLVICEGEFDCLSLIECGITNAVSIPSGVNGTNEWITTNYDFIEQFDEVVIWFDNDEPDEKGKRPGLEGARETFNRLNNKSVKIVYLKDANDINEVLFRFGKDKVLEELRNASTPMIDGVKKTSQIGRFNIHDVEKLKTGFLPVDKAIIGVPYGSLVVLTGRPGEGKSTVLNQICIGQSIKSNKKVFLFSGELMEETTKGWMFHTLANKSQLTVKKNEYGDEYAFLGSREEACMDEMLEDKIYIHTDDNYMIDSIIDKMEILAKRYGAKIFAIDNLMVVEEDDKDEFRTQTKIVKKLKAFAKKYKAIVYLVAHPRKGNSSEELANEDVSGSGNIINLGDYVMSIRRVKDENGNDAYTSFKVSKNRYTGKLVSVKLKFDEQRRRFYTSDEKLELGVDFLAINQEFIQVECEGWEN